VEIAAESTKIKNNKK